MVVYEVSQVMSQPPSEPELRLVAPCTLAGATTPAAGLEVTPDGVWYVVKGNEGVCPCDITKQSQTLPKNERKPEGIGPRFVWDGP